MARDFVLPRPDPATVARAVLLDAASEESFDRVWKLIVECGEQERHFGNLQGIYRGLASTWLLAMFAGVGFLLKENPPEKWALIFATGLATSIGIVMLWMLDVLVYHRLLLANFHDGKQLERAYRWLPPSRNRMKSLVVKDAVRKTVALLYSGLLLMPGIVAAWGGFRWQGRCGVSIAVIVVISLLACIWLGTLKLSIPSGDEIMP